MNIDMGETMRLVKLLKSSLAAAALAASLTLTASPATSETWNMPTAYSATIFHTEHLERFAAKVAEYTGGGLTITVHPSGSLIPGERIKDAVRSGVVPIGERLMSAHADKEPLFGWDSLPLLATNYEESDRLWKAARARVNARLADLNLVALYTCPWPGQGLYFDKEVNSGADVRGIRFRTYNQATTALAEGLGMNPVQIELVNLKAALTAGVVEAFTSGPSTGNDQELYDLVSHFYDVNASLPRNYVIVNKSVFDGLDADTRSALLKAAEETGMACARESMEQAGRHVRQLEENGMTVAVVGSALLKELEAIGAEIQARWIERVGPDGAAIIEAYRKN